MIGLMLLVEPKIPGSLSYFYILPIPHAHGSLFFCTRQW